MPEDYRTIGARELIAQQQGHHFHHGMHIGWAWGEDPRRGCFLDFLSEHRMAGMHAERFFANGTAELIDTPAEMRMVAEDPDEDAEFERTFIERNRAAYAALRERGLLPPAGANFVSQDINEYLVTGGDDVAAGPPGNGTKRT